jgi:hypothetical protein
MSAIVPNEDFIKKHYDKTMALLAQYQLSELTGLLETFSEEYAVCPASSKKEYYSAFPGGLAYHNLHVLQWVGRFAGSMGADLFTKKSLLTTSILHSFGKVGLKDQPYYLKTLEEWKLKKGIYYEINPDLVYMKVPQRSLFLAQQAGVPLNEEEYLAILLADGHLDETNAHYRYKEPKLATVLQYAVHWARKIEKEKKVNWP